MRHMIVLDNNHENVPPLRMDWLKDTLFSAPPFDGVQLERHDFQ